MSKYERVVGVSSCVGDYSKHILMYDIDNCKTIDDRELLRIYWDNKIDLHFFKSSKDGVHIISFDVFDDLYELDGIQKELRKCHDDEKDKPYMTILEIIAEGALHGDAHALALKGELPDGWIEARTKWRANVLRIGKKGNKEKPKWLISLFSPENTRLKSQKHLEIYKMLGFRVPLYYNKMLINERVAVSIYKTSHRL